MTMKNISKKVLISVTAVAVAAQAGFAPDVYASAADVSMPSHAFSLPMIRGLQFDPAEPLNFNFVVDLADENSISEEDAVKLVRYFLAVLTIPENDLWVNLSPDGEDRIIPQSFGATEAGEELLKQDLILKKLSASLLNPEQETGRRFWDSVYQKLYDVYGVSDVPQEALQRIWIVPQKAVIDEFKNAAYISESRLKVLTEDAYQGEATTPAQKIIQETILPVIEEEINTGENFAPLRQVYHSMILAVWFKTKLKDHIVNRVYSNQSKVKGIDMADEKMASELFDSYLKVFRSSPGSIQDEYDPYTQQMVAREYVTGGFSIAKGHWLHERAGTPAMLARPLKMVLVSISLFAASSFLVPDHLSAQSASNPTTVLSYEWQGQKASSYKTNDIHAFSGYQSFIDFVQWSHIENLMKNRTLGSNVRDILRKHNVNELNFKNILAKNPYGPVHEIFVFAAQYDLFGGESADSLNDLVQKGIDGDLGQKTFNEFPNSNSPGVSAGSEDVSAGGPGIGLTINNVPDSLLGGEFKPDFADESYQRSLYATEVSVKTPVSPLNFKFPSTNVGSALTNISLAKDRQLIAAYFANVHSRSTGGAPPPPFSAMAWTDFGRKPWAYYGTYNLTYDPNGPLSFWTTTEPTGLWQKSEKPAYTVAQYFGFGYQANPSLLLSLEERLGLKGGVNRLTTASAKFTPKNGKYSLTAMFHLPRMWSDAENHYMNQQALTFSAGTTLLGISITPAVFYGPDFSDWSLNVAYNFSSSFGFSFEKNFKAAYGFYNYVPNLPLRLNILYTMGNWGFVPYLSSTTYNLFDSQFVYGLALKRTFTFPKPRAVAKITPNSGESFTSTPLGQGDSNKAMMTDEYGGIDLKMDNAQLETRIHGNFEGLNNWDVNLINPETFTGFGVKLIRMVPIFDLSKVFVSADGELVMISQL